MGFGARSQGPSKALHLADSVALALWGWGSLGWVWLLRILAALGHRRAKARCTLADAPNAALHRHVPPASSHARLWMHCASLGEVEQAIPVLQAHRAAHPDTPWLLTVYSPSGWNPLQAHLAKGTMVSVLPGWRPNEDHLAVLPDDRPSVWRRVLSDLSIGCLALAKYDLWPNLLREVHRRGIPIHVFAAAPSAVPSTPSTPSPALAPASLPSAMPSTPAATASSRMASRVPLVWRLRGGAVWRLVTTVSCQDALATQFFEQGGIEAHADGDPRVERVLRREVELTPDLLAWSRAAKQVVVAGSTWAAEERALASMTWSSERRLLLVPHDLSPIHLGALDRQWEGRAVRWTTWRSLPAADRLHHAVVVVDAVGLLFGLYRLPNTAVAVVGGGHGSGLHNVLEPASAGLPIVTGPKLGRFREAHALLGAGALKSGSLGRDLAFWLARPDAARRAGQTARQWVQSQSGAAARIVARW